MLPLRAFLTGEPALAVYWGTTGQRLTDGYRLDAFGCWQLQKQGRLLAGDDLRGGMSKSNEKDAAHGQQQMCIRDRADSALRPHMRRQNDVCEAAREDTRCGLFIL